MKQKRLIVIFLTIVTALSLLTVSLVMADTDTPATPPTKDDASSTASQLLGGSEIELHKTVGLPGTPCSTQPSLFVSETTQVQYCYRVINTGNTTLTLHNLVDSELGPLLSNFPFSLTLGADVFVTTTANITATTINTAAWTAYNPGPTDVVTETDSAHVYVTDAIPTCSAPNLSIPDNNITGTSDILTISDNGTLVDLDVYLDVRHTWVGDLVFTLTHEATGTDVRLFDRPGIPGSTFGCSGDNIHIFIDDEATLTTEDDCQGSTDPAYQLGGSYQPSQTLSLLDGLDYSGDWRLTVSDNAGGDTGVLEQWCLLPTFEPDIQVEPSSLAAVQPPDTQTMQTLMIHNNAAGTLSWHIFESFASAAQQIHSQIRATVQSRMPVENPGPATDEVDLMADALLANSRPQPTMPSAVLSPDDNHVLYDNGPLVNAPGAGAGGADASAVQSVGLGMSTLGFAHQADLGNRIADEFTITDTNGWVIDSITFYAYQTGSPITAPITSTITAVNYQIWDGSPDDPGSQVIFGDLVYNRLAQTGWSGIFRTTDNPSSITSTLRPIMTNIVSAGVVLPPGTYWLDWQADGPALYSGPWAPPITISGTITTGNALQYFAGAWIAVQDSATAAQQGFPFILSGYPVEDIPWATVSPISGTTPGNTTTSVNVTFDSTGLSLGSVYTGTLYVESNDIDTPLISVPLTLTIDLYKIYLPFVARPD